MTSNCVKNQFGPRTGHCTRGKKVCLQYSYDIHYSFCVCFETSSFKMVAVVFGMALAALVFVILGNFYLLSKYYSRIRNESSFYLKSDYFNLEPEINIG